ncbi:MAG: FAD-binding oxidoreductase [Candidatus Nomurabacteria bacterium]|jgi:FAD/FMN-containing dehydrogenase|nr:FAD-binding oxidoreductase [Candidatus Nomurabacteria bacterium]
MQGLANYLNRRLDGIAYVAPRVRDAYDTDYSALKIKPTIVVVPSSTRDIQRVVGFANQVQSKGVKMGITPRGSGTDKTGAAIGNGIILDMRSEMNKIMELDPAQRLVRVQAGISLRELNNALAVQGLTIPVAAGDQTIGGMLANNYTSVLSRKYGGILRYIVSAEAVLADGSLMRFDRFSDRELKKRLKKTNGLEHEIYQKIPELHRQNADILDQNRYRNAGYALDRIRMGNHTNFLRLIAGSQGTLGIVTELILHADYFEEMPTMLIGYAEDAAELARWSHEADKLGVVFADFYDKDLVAHAALLGKGNELLDVPTGAKYLAIFAFDDHSTMKRRHKTTQMAQIIGGRPHISSENNYGQFLATREMLGIYLNDTTRGERTAMMDDVFVAPNMLPELADKIAELAESTGLDLQLFGSLATGIINLRPRFELGSVQGRQRMQFFMDKYAKIIDEVGGDITGGAPEGRTKAHLIQRTDEEQDLQQAVKDIFDPKNLLNPNVKLNTPKNIFQKSSREDYLDGIIVA